MKMQTILVDLTAIPATIKNATSEQDVAHNQQVRMRRRLEKEALKQQAEALNLMIHIGHTAVLLRGTEEAMSQLEVAGDLPVREASERFRPLRG